MVKIFVEGGGDANNRHNLRAQCRQAFHKLIQKTGITAGYSIVASGGRNDAYKDYCLALEQLETAMLLIDSEGTIAPTCQIGSPETWLPWQHLHTQDHWVKPPHAEDELCHLMVECMEAWLIADSDNMKRFYGERFHSCAHDISNMPKADLLKELINATKVCGKPGAYSKRKHSFTLLATLNPDRISCPWAIRFFQTLKRIAS